MNARATTHGVHSKSVSGVTTAPVNCLTTAAETWTGGQESMPRNGRCHSEKGGGGGGGGGGSGGGSWGFLILKHEQNVPAVYYSQEKNVSE